MALVVNTNTASLFAQNSLNKSQASLQTSIQRLSSGLRINSAADDAAGLAIATRMDSQIRGMNVAIRNANDGISLSQTAEGNLEQITVNLQRIRELAVQASNATNSATDNANLDAEVQNLKTEIDRVAVSANFNGINLLDGSFTAKAFQVGPSSGDSITIAAISDTRIAALGINASNVTTAANAQTALTAVDAALTTVNSSRANLGAVQNTFSSAVASLQTSSQNLSAARGRIMDADFSAETANLTRANILQQAGTAVLAQANQLPSQVLSLLR